VPGGLLVAVPLQRDERLTGAVLGRRGDREMTEDIHGAWLVLAAVAAGIILAGVLAALVLGGWLARPLERLGGAARRLGDGDFSARAPRAGIPEVDGVATALDATAERLGELIARERAFSADASHQLRTPLAALRIELEALELRSDDPELAAAIAQVERLQATIDTLLAVARDHPRADQVAAVAPVLDALGAAWHGPLAADGRPLRFAGDVRAVQVRASAGVLREVLEVLLANAYTHGRGTVTVGVRSAGDWVFVEVADEGAGFRDPETPFARRGSSRSGHGIGLALARALAHAEGGRLAITRTGPEPAITLTLRSATVDPELREAADALAR
jgi:signal transduction histidine kinase